MTRASSRTDVFTIKESKLIDWHKKNCHLCNFVETFKVLFTSLTWWSLPARCSTPALTALRDFCIWFRCSLLASCLCCCACSLCFHSTICRSLVKRNSRNEFLQSFNPTLSLLAPPTWKPELLQNILHPEVLCSGAPFAPSAAAASSHYLLWASADVDVFPSVR